MLCAWKYLKYWQYSGDQDRQNPFPYESYILTGRKTAKQNKKINKQGIIT